jgi:hypothetical protein
VNGSQWTFVIVLGEVLAFFAIIVVALGRKP